MSKPARPDRFMSLFFAIIAVAVVVGCDPPKQHHDPAVVLAERTNSNGAVTQFVMQRNYTTQLMWFTPEGSKNSVTADIRFYFQEAGKPRRDLPVKGHDFVYSGTFKPVEHSPLWIGVGMDSGSSAHPVGHPVTIRDKVVTSRNENNFYVAVFDDTHVLAYHKFLVIPKMETGEDAFRFKDGYRTIVFLSPTGPKKYNVVKDSVEDAVDEKWPSPHL